MIGILPVEPMPTTALKIRFPVYALRGFDTLGMYGDNLVVVTRHATYVLDVPHIGADLKDRRVKMLGMKFGEHKIYPLKERISSISQLIKTKKRIFIDADGKVIKYVKTRKMFPVQYCKVLNADRTWNGYFLLTTKLPVRFVAERPSNYIGYIKAGSSYFLFEQRADLEEGLATRRAI